MPGLWKRALVYLGLAEDDEYADYTEYDDDGPPRPGAPGPDPARGPYGAPPSEGDRGVNLIPGGERYPHAVPPYADPYQQQPYPGGTMTYPPGAGGFGGPSPFDQPPQSSTQSAVKTLPPQPTARLHMVTPQSFEHGAKELGDKFKGNAPVILVLTGIDKHLARRLLDYAAGVVYALSGKITSLADSVFLLTPRGTEVSAEEKRRFTSETGLLFDEDD